MMSTHHCATEATHALQGMLALSQTDQDVEQDTANAASDLTRQALRVASCFDASDGSVWSVLIRKVTVQAIHARRQ